MRKLALAVGLMALAAVFFVVFQGGDGAVDKDFFYDLSEKKLFEASRKSVPPIRGLNDAEEDAVRAIVISITGDVRDKSSHQIAYLEKYTPELKRQIENAQETGDAPPMGRGAAQWQRLVRTMEEDVWYPVASPQGEVVVSRWAVPGPNGVTPVVCTP